MTASCPLCGCDQADSLLCDRDTASLRTDLQGNGVVMGVAELVDNLHVAMAKQVRGADLGKSGLARERMPVNLEAGRHVRELEYRLGTWAMDVTGDHWWPRPGRYVAAEAAGLLAGSLDRIRRHGAVNELVAEITRSIDDARRCLDVEPFTRFPVGPCPEDDCTRTVFALCPSEESTRPALMACYQMVPDERRPDLGAGFTHTWETHQWLRAGRRILDTIEKRKGRAA